MVFLEHCCFIGKTESVAMWLMKSSTSIILWRGRGRSQAAEMVKEIAGLRAGRFTTIGTQGCREHIQRNVMKQRRKVEWSISPQLSPYTYSSTVRNAAFGTSCWTCSILTARIHILEGRNHVPDSSYRFPYRGEYDGRTYLCLPVQMHHSLELSFQLNKNLLKADKNSIHQAKE